MAKVERPPRDVVVLDLEEHLRLVHVPRVRMAVHDAVDVMRERRAVVAAALAFHGPAARRRITAEERVFLVQHRLLDGET